MFRQAVYKLFAEVTGIVMHGEGGRGTKRSADKMSSPRSASHLPTGGKKRQLRSDKDGGVGEDDSDEEGDGKSNKKARPDPKFACPYYKHDPEKYRSHRTCLGPGFPTVHRVR